MLHKKVIMLSLEDNVKNSGSSTVETIAKNIQISFLFSKELDILN